jgi:hypothetical protein
MRCRRGVRVQSNAPANHADNPDGQAGNAGHMPWMTANKIINASNGPARVL